MSKQFTSFGFVDSENNSAKADMSTDGPFLAYSLPDDWLEDTKEF